jgi:hypothetical protein
LNRAREFGLAPLIGKPLAIISDARFAGEDSSIVVERLLSISGEDRLTVNRKYRDQWTGKLPSRLHIISNELPELGDASTAIVGRIVLVPLTKSWLGQEDHDLEPALHRELPGILNWALAGLHSLTVKNGAGMQFRVRPTVFHPRYFISSRRFAKFIATLDIKGKQVIDVGTGTRILAIAAVRAEQPRLLPPTSIRVDAIGARERAA